MSFRSRLFAPGPVEVPPRVLAACARPPLHHRSAEFRALFFEVRERLARLACVEGDDALLLGGSGTAAFEAGLLACVPRGAKILAVNSGKFGARWAELARRYGFEVAELTVDWGGVAHPDELARSLSGASGLAAVTMVHSETSTGGLNDVAALARVVREASPEALVLVDAVTSLGVAELRPREWGLDGVFAGSQKGLMCPPGLGFAWLSERAWAASERLSPTFYLDLRRERAAQAGGHSAYTPAVTLIAGLNVALEMLLEEGIERVWSRRATLNRAVLEGGRALGLQPFAARASPAVAALRVPEGIYAPDVVAAFASRGARIAGGQDTLKATVIRPSLMGYCDAYDALTVVAILEEALGELGVPVRHGSGVEAAVAALRV